MSEFKIEGFAELLADLKQFEPKLAKGAVARAVRAGSKVIVRAARDRAPKRVNEWEGMKYANPPGTLKKGITVNRDTRAKKFGLVRDVIGFSPRAWYGRLVETGHKIVTGGTLSSGSKNHRKSRGGGKVVGHVAARPFLRPAFDANIENAVDEMRKTLGDEVDKINFNILQVKKA